MEKKSKSELQKTEHQESSFWLEFLVDHWFYILLALLLLLAKIFNVGDVPMCELFGCDRERPLDHVVTK